MPEKLRNIGILAHVDAGKTTLTENLLYACGETRRLGRVDDGTARTDQLDVERRRGISVTAASVSMAYMDAQINLIDTPGHVDFCGEVERALGAVDGVILLMSAVEGIQAQTEVLWDILRKNNIPTIFFVNKLDRTGADCASVTQAIRQSFTASLLPLNEACGEGTPCCSVKSLGWNDERIASVAETDDALTERYLNGDALDPDTLVSAACKAVSCARLFPLLYGSAMHGIGIKQLLDAIIDFFPEPDAGNGGLSALVFKLEHDRAIGRVAHARIFSGTLKNRDSVTLPSGETCKIVQIRRNFASKAVDIGTASAGDIVSLCGLGDIKSGELIGARPAHLPEYHIATPLLRAKILPFDTDSAYAPLVAAVHELSDEDPLLNMEWRKDERELIVNVMGVIQLEVLEQLLIDRFGIRAVFSKPSVIYKETPSKAAYGFDAYTMPKPCWAVLRFYIEPMARGFGFEYAGHVPNDKMFYRYQEHVREAIPGTLKQGLHGWEVTDLRITLVDGEHHTIHTHPLDFFTCTPMAVRNGYANCGMTLLEPYVTLRVTLPEELGGKLIRDFIDMRGSYDSPVIRGGRITIDGVVPVAESMNYAARLGIMSGGRGIMSAAFDGYHECPDGLGQSVPYRGVDPLDRAKYILKVRGAIQ